MAKSKRGVPPRKAGESLVDYHDRLSALAAEALKGGKTQLSKRLQRRAGQLAHDHREVADRVRHGKESGPGTLPWKQCVSEQAARGHDDARSRAICGRIRADSRERYPDYWEARGAPRSANPQLGDTGKTPEAPYAAIAIDGGPRAEQRDLVVVLDRQATILEVFPILGEHSLDDFGRKYPGIPLYGPFLVLASQLREICRTADRGATLVESKVP